MTQRYRTRQHAGEVLAARLSGYAGRPGTIVLGLVRGGVPVATVVADRLGAPLDVLVVRKLGVPWSPEVAFGALGPGGVRVINDAVASRISADQVNQVLAAESAELRRRERQFRAGRPPLTLAGRVAIIVDDGLATGATARAAVLVARRLDAARVVLAAPVGAPEAVAALSQVADEVACPLRPADFGAVSRYFGDFHQVSDEEVAALLAAAGTV